MDMKLSIVIPDEWSEKLQNAIAGRKCRSRQDFVAQLLAEALGVEAPAVKPWGGRRAATSGPVFVAPRMERKTIADKYLHVSDEQSERPATPLATAVRKQQVIHQRLKQEMDDVESDDAQYVDAEDIP
jgi:hypothetical protein